MKQIKNTYLYLEPYIHVEICKNKLLLFNQLTGEIIEETETNITDVFRRLKNENNVIITKITQTELGKKYLIEFIDKLRQSYFGDIITSNQMPIQVKPMLKIHYNYETLYGPNILSNLLELSIYLNNYDKVLFPIKFLDAYKQFPTNYSSNENNHLYVNDVIKFINESKKGWLFKINIFGGNIFEYNYFEDLVIYLNSLNQKIEYYHYYKDKFDINKLKMIRDNSSFNIIVDFPVNENYLEEIYQMIPSSFTTRVDFIVENEDEMNIAEDISLKHSLKKIKINPYFNRLNKKFFIEQIYINKSEIYDIKPSQLDLFKNQTLNSFYFGKLTILNNGSVFTNINSSCVGTIKDSIYEIVHNALKCKVSWRLIREDVSPCNNCIYKAFCPPVSNYEYVLKSFNLCII